MKGDKILNTAAKTKYYGKHIREVPGEDAFYGYGWVVIPTPRNTELITHNGGNGVFYADFWRFPTEELVVIVLSNKASGFAEDLAMDVARAMLSE